MLTLWLNFTYSFSQSSSKLFLKLGLLTQFIAESGRLPYLNSSVTEENIYRDYSEHVPEIFLIYYLFYYLKHIEINLLDSSNLCFPIPLRLEHFSIDYSFVYFVSFYV